MSFATKAVFVGAAGLVAISFAGAGVGAVMEDTATARATVGIGSGAVTVGPDVTSLGQLPALYAVASPSNGAIRMDAVGGQRLRITQSHGPEGNSVAVAGMPNRGAGFTEIVPLTVTNSGSMSLHRLSLTVAGVTDAFTNDSSVFICSAAGNATWLGGTFNPADHGCQHPVALAAVESDPLSVRPTTGELESGQAEALTVVIDHRADQRTAFIGSFAPTITMAASAS